MIRLSRAGREAAIVQAIKQLHARGRYQCFTQGEICRKMGITSQSKIRDILRNMVKNHQIVSGGTAMDGYNHEIAVYGLAANEQTGLPLSYGTNINGEWVEMSGEVIHNYVAV